MGNLSRIRSLEGQYSMLVDILQRVNPLAPLADGIGLVSHSIRFLGIAARLVKDCS